MKTQGLCNQCGKPLPQNAADATCPSCLLEWGLGIPPDDLFTVPGNVTAEPHPASSLITRLTYFGDYELLEEIVRGGMGVVYKARQVSLNRTVAVKMILAGHFAGKDAMQRFKTEAEAAARLHHPNIVGIHEVGLREGFHYFSMDYIEGRNLGEVAREKPVAPRQAAEWVKTTAQAIHYAHDRDILHRDIKPSNILIDPLNVPHVTDFGLAKQVEGHSDITASGEILGSPNYMPPEQAGVRRGQVGRPSDVYSLGAVLYHLMVGRPPFVRATVAETVHDVIHQEVASLRLLNPSTPQDLETICLKCLEKEPRRRYQSAQELADELGRFLRDEPILARPLSIAEKTWRWCRRKPAIAVLAVSLVLVFLLGLTGVVTQLRRVQAKSEEHRRELAQLHVLSGVQLMQAGDFFKSLLWFTEALDLDKAILAREQIHQMRIAAVLEQCPKLVQLIAHDGQPIIGAAFSPTDDRLATIGQDRTARVWEIPSGKLLKKTKPLSALPYFISFSPDGTRLMVVLLDNTVRLLDPATGKQTVVALAHRIEGADNTVFLPVFDSTGKKLVTQPKEKELQIWDVVTGQPAGARIVHTNQLDHVQFSADGEHLFSRAQRNFAWDAQTGELVVFPVSGPDAIENFYFNQHANLAVVGGRIWKLATGKRDFEVPAPGPATVGLQAETDRLKSKLRAEPVGEPLMDAGLLIWAAFSPAGDRLLTANRDGTTRIWDTATAKPITPPLSHDQIVDYAKFSPDGHRLLTVSQDRITRVWDADTGQPLTPPIGHAPGAVMSAFSGSGRYFLTVAPEYLASVWDLHQEVSPPALLKPLGAMPDESASLGGTLVSKEANNVIRVKSMLSSLNVPLHPISMKTAPMQSWFDATKRFVILEGKMAKVQIWDTLSGIPITPLVQSHYTQNKTDYESVKLPQSGLSSTTAVELAQLLSGSRLDGSGAWTNLNFEDLASRWERLSRKYPSLFRDPATDRVAWHRREAEAAQGALDWPAAVFHWKNLRSLEPGKGEFAERHEYAVKCLAKAIESAQSYSERRRVIPRRDPQADAHMIDLTDFFTGSVIDGLRSGVQTFGGVHFDIRGVIELFGREPEVRGIRHPEDVPGVKIQKRCERIHLLHTAKWADSNKGKQIATLVVNYANGQIERIAIQDVVQIASDWSSYPFAPEQADVVWIGTNPVANSFQTCIRLFKYTWLNPHPDWELSHIDLLSTKGRASYVLVAMTLE